MKLFKGLVISFVIILSFINSNLIYAWDTPVMNSPVNNSQSWNLIELDWSPVFYSNGYQIQIDTSSAFTSSLLIDTIIPYIDTTGFGDTHLSIDELFFGTTYFWRVRAFAVNDTSSWSASWTVTTRDDVEIVGPVSGSYNFVSVFIDWNSHVGVDFYDYQVDTSASFNSPALTIGTNYYFSEQNNFFDSEHLLGNLYYGSLYHWRIRARNSIDTSAWVSSTFNTKEFVEANFPTNGALTSAGVLIDWLEFEGTYFYDFQIDITSNFNSSSLITGSDLSLGSGSANSDTEEFIDDLFFGANYFWRVRSRHVLDTSEWVVNSFITTDNIELVSPLSAENTECEVNLDWNAFSGVDFYEYQIDNTISFNSSNLITGQNVYINEMNNNGDTESLISPLLFGTTYFWRVRAINAVDTTTWSDVWSLNTMDEILLLSPGNTSSTFTTILFDWEDFAGVDEYIILIDTSSLFNSALVINTNIVGISEKNIENLYFGYNYYWKVKGSNSIDNSDWSEVWTFYTYNEVGLFTPLNGAMNEDTLGVNLDWWYHLGANEYQLEIDSSNMFNTNFLIQEFISYIAPVANGPDTEYLTGQLENDKVYFWRVRVINEMDTSQWETHWFSTGNLPLDLPDLPVLLSPLHNEADVVTDPVLDWSDVSGVTGYYYEYSQSSDFNNSVSGFVSQSQLSLSSLNYMTDYFWKVRSYDGNLVSDWTLPYHFITAQEELLPPVLILPVSGATAVEVDNLFFDWVDVYHAQSYELVYSPYDNFLFDVVTEISLQSQFSVNSVLPGTTYFWKVRSLNDTLINSIYSDVWSFTTQSQLEVPVLLSPVNSSYNNPYNNLTLSWEAVSNADGYEVQYAKDMSFTLDVVEEITVNPYLLITSLDSNTGYYWRVKSTSAVYYNSDYTYTWSFVTEEDTTNSIVAIDDFNISLYPNPTNGIVSVELGDQSFGVFEFRLYDYSGREVLYKSSNESFINLDLTGLRSGVYFLSIIANGNNYYKRIVKN